MKTVLKKSRLALAGSIALMGSTLWAPTATACSVDPMLGSMCIFAGNFAPRGWAFTDGQLLAISQNTALFAILGTTYGGDGRTTFALPDTRGRAVIGPRHGPGLSTYELGKKGGAEKITLTLPQMPVHDHMITATAKLRASTAAAARTDPDGSALGETTATIYASGTPDVDMAADSVEVQATAQNTGGNSSHENRMPYIAINYVIALQGIFPSRN